MFWKAARQSAQLKGERYEGAIIIEAVWHKVSAATEVQREDNLVMPKILRDRHHLLQVLARDGEDELIITMLLGRKAPHAEAEVANRKVLTAYVQGDALDDNAGAKTFIAKFSAQQVQAFVTQVNDTNALHQGARPLVPGLLLLQTVAENCDARSVQMRFSVPVFADEQVTIRLLPEKKNVQMRK